MDGKAMPATGVQKSWKRDAGELRKHSAAYLG
jgi:hypothetical protein